VGWLRSARCHQGALLFSRATQSVQQDGHPDDYPKHKPGSLTKLSHGGASRQHKPLWQSSEWFQEARPEHIVPLRERNRMSKRALILGLKYHGLPIACAVVTMCVLRPFLIAQTNQGQFKQGLFNGAAQEQSGAAISNAAPSNQVCEARANDTLERLLECIQQQALWNHLAKFQQIADENRGSDGHGNRDTGTSGYKASVDYVAGLMRQAGYRVTIQPYQYTGPRSPGCRNSVRLNSVMF